MRTEVRFTGSGGQGLILASRIVARAALLESKNVLQSQVYGAEARGGATKSEIIISNLEIFFPHIHKPDILLIMTKEACKKYGNEIKEDGLRIIDSFMVEDIQTSNTYQTYSIPFTELAERHFNTKVIANMIALGFISKISSVVTIDSLIKTLNYLLNGENLKKNIEAINYGYEYSS